MTVTDWSKQMLKSTKEIYQLTHTGNRVIYGQNRSLIGMLQHVAQMGRKRFVEIIILQNYGR